MTYIPGGEAIAVPDALVVIESSVSSSGQSLVTGNRINLSTITSLEGSWTPSVSSDIITLDAGYYYYLEAAQQAYFTGSTSSSAYIETQWYNETTSASVGTIGLMHISIYEDSNLTSSDEVACLLIDATASAVDVSVKIGGFSIFSSINSSNTQNIYAGYGRQLIWRLTP